MAKGQRIFVMGSLPEGPPIAVPKPVDHASEVLSILEECPECGRRLNGGVGWIGPHGRGWNGSPDLAALADATIVMFTEGANQSRIMCARCVREIMCPVTLLGQLEENDA